MRCCGHIPNSRLANRAHRPPLENGTALESRWYAVQTRSRHEKLVASQLENRGIATFLPLAGRISCWSDRRKLVRLPLFPGYVFVHVVSSPQARVQILRTRGVVALLGARGEGAPIPDMEVENIQKLLTHNVPFTNSPFIKSGQRVRIRGGCMDGVEGILMGRNGHRSLVIAVEMVERSLAIKLGGFDVEPI